MNTSLKRREFIKTLYLSGVSIAIANPVSSNSLFYQPNEVELRSRYFK